MNKFEKQLEKWNNGVLRGAQAKLAKTLGVSTATTAQWATGKRHPSKGYVSKMAELFRIDVFDALKLFNDQSTTYPEISLRSRLLRETPEGEAYYCSAEEEYFSPQTNTVRLPFLNTVPDSFPQYDEGDVIEWWSVPRRYALGAKYIIRSIDAGLDGAENADDLCFVQPTDTLTQQGTTLWKSNSNYFCGRCVQDETERFLVLSASRRIPLPVKSSRQLGKIVRRIHDA